MRYVPLPLVVVLTCVLAACGSASRAHPVRPASPLILGPAGTKGVLPRAFPADTVSYVAVSLNPFGSSLVQGAVVAQRLQTLAPLRTWIVTLEHRFAPVLGAVGPELAVGRLPGTPDEAGEFPDERRDVIVVQVRDRAAVEAFVGGHLHGFRPVAGTVGLYAGPGAALGIDDWAGATYYLDVADGVAALSRSRAHAEEAVARFHGSDAGTLASDATFRTGVRGLAAHAFLIGMTRTKDEADDSDDSNRIAEVTSTLTYSLAANARGLSARVSFVLTPLGKRYLLASYEPKLFRTVPASAWQAVTYDPGGDLLTDHVFETYRDWIARLLSYDGLTVADARMLLYGEAVAYAENVSDDDDLLASVDLRLTTSDGAKSVALLRKAIRASDEPLAKKLRVSRDGDVVTLAYPLRTPAGAATGALVDDPAYRATIAGGSISDRRTAGLWYLSPRRFAGLVGSFTDDAEILHDLRAIDGVALATSRTDDALTLDLYVDVPAA